LVPVHEGYDGPIKPVFSRYSYQCGKYFMKVWVNPMIYTSGGGMHNPLLMKKCQGTIGLGCAFEPPVVFNGNPDARSGTAVWRTEAVAGGKKLREVEMRQGHPLC